MYKLLDPWWWNLSLEEINEIENTKDNTEEPDPDYEEYAKAEFEKEWKMNGDEAINKYFLKMLDNRIVKSKSFINWFGWWSGGFFPYDN